MGFYRSIHDRISARPGLCRVLEISVKLLPGLVYGAYPLMLLGLLLFRRELLLRAVLVPAAGLLIATGLRAWINAPRPYEALGIPPLTPKETKGKSFPSRHAACAAVIAVTALKVLPPLGAVLWGIALLIAIAADLVCIFLLRVNLSLIDAGVAVIFAGYIGYDWSRAQAYPKTLDNAVDCAADIYVDIVNLFIRILSIIGNSKKE